MHRRSDDHQRYASHSNRQPTSGTLQAFDYARKQLKTARKAPTELIANLVRAGLGRAL